MAILIRRLLLWALVSTLCFASPAGAAQEYAVKAAFLLNFARLVEWPSDALPPKSKPWMLCVLGDAPFGQKLEETFRGKRVQQRKTSIVRIDSVDAVDGCHMVFVTRQTDARHQVLERTRSRSVLVVGESEGYADEGAVINLFEESGKIRFEINLAAARSARLQVSSRLSRLARIVGEGR